MTALQDKARALLESGAAQVVIGYAAGSKSGREHAVFFSKPEQCQLLVFNDHCTSNLAVYLVKPEVKALGKPAIVATPAAVRTVLQLAAENQLADGGVIALAATADGAITELADLQSMEQFVANSGGAAIAPDPLVKELWAMSHAERWRFWTEQFSACMKCYACRASCPLCYCERCVVECNQPQWIPVSPHAEGNLEWHVVRAMHLAGRCIDCGFCADACPVHIPLNLLTRMLREKMAEELSAQPGTSAHSEYALSAFRPEDKEGFIR